MKELKIKLKVSTIKELKEIIDAVEGIAKEHMYTCTLVEVELSN